MILRIVAQDFVAGVETEHGRVSDAAPVLDYMVGWPHGKVLDFCYLKGWSVTELDSTCQAGRGGHAPSAANRGSNREIAQLSPQPLTFPTSTNTHRVAECQDLRMSCCVSAFAAESSKKELDLKTKLVQWKNKGSYLVMVGSGELTKQSIKKIFRTVREATCTTLDCKILIDLQDATTFMTSSDVDTLGGELEVSFTGHGIVFVCPVESAQYFALRALSASLAQRGYRAAVFGDPKMAADWLATIE